MAAPATSKRESALQDVKTVLEAVTKGSNYNYEYGTVARIDGPFFIHLDTQNEAMAFIEEGATQYTLETHSGIHEATVEIFIGVAAKYEPDTDSPLTQTTDSKGTIRSKLVSDIAKAVLADHTRDNNARITRLTDDGPVQLDEIGEDEDGNPVWFPNEWVAHELRFEIDYELDETTP